MSVQELVLLGDYVLLSQIGEGTLGKVYLSQHRFLKKHFILKVLPNALSQDPSFIKRFEKEIAHLAALDHPNLLKMENVSFADEQYFLASEYIQDDACNLAKLLEQKQLKEEEIISIIEQVADALDYIHEKNIDDAPLAHRGLKLNNILVDQKLQVKLTDFGLTRIFGVDSLLEKTYSILWENVLENKEIDQLSRVFLEYYAFLAPEQKNKTDREQDAKADSYAFGVLLYYLLTNKYPDGHFPMPSFENPALKWNFDSVIKQCLHPHPEERPFYLKEFLKSNMQMIDTREVRPKLEPKELERPAYEPDPGAIFQTDKNVAIYTPKKHEIKEIEPLLTEMSVIEGGTFMRGCNDGARDEMPRHNVNLHSFAIDIHPVTNEQFIRFLETMGGEKDSNNNDIIRLRESRIRRNAGKLIIESGYAKHPVVGVTWYGAMAYAKWIGKRLPTEAEWEIAACGGLESAHYPTGDDIERSQANFFNSDTTSVMSYPPNESGLHDIAGNVYEWCLDWYEYHYYETSAQEPDNPKGPVQGVYRVLRGGCWKSLKEDMRCAHRHRNNPGVMNGTYGFRCCADVTA